MKKIISVITFLIMALNMSMPSMAYNKGEQGYLQTFSGGSQYSMAVMSDGSLAMG